MRPEISTRKVNTILKCQEINDIVLSFYGPVGEGDKCLALFTAFLPICDLFLSPSHSLCLCVCSSLTLHLPFLFLPPFVSSLVLLRWPWSPDAKGLSKLPCVNAAATCDDRAGDAALLYAVCGCQQMNSIDPSSLGGDEISTQSVYLLSGAQNSSFCSRPSNCALLLSQLWPESETLFWCLVVQMLTGLMCSGFLWCRSWLLPCSSSTLAWGPSFNQLCIIGVIPCLAVYFYPSV